jgi:hypothetical protein
MSLTGLAARLNEIHAQLLSGSRTASRDLFIKALAPLQRFLAREQPTLSDDERHDLATETLIAYLQAPQQFDPQQRSLWGYLCMLAQADALDIVRKRARRRDLLRKQTLDVELWWSDANNVMGAETRIDARRILERYGHKLVTNEVERRVLELLLSEERSTDAFANALGLPTAAGETQELIKQTKDRMLARLRRLRDEL